MYFEHFGLTKNPFLLSTETDSLYYARSHREMMGHLLYGVRQGNGIILLLGAPGTGKTTLLRALLELLAPSEVVPSVVFSPMLETPVDVLRQVLAGFDVRACRGSALELFATLQTFIENLVEQGKQPLLVIDEAQRLNAATLDCLRLISGLENQGQQSVRMLLAAQPEMASLIATEGMTALRQRVYMRCNLSALQFEEVWRYLAVRIAGAGGGNRVIFLPEAVDALALYSSGVPRVLNLLADHCLIAAYSEGAERVDAKTAMAVARSLELVPDNSMHNRALQRNCPTQFTDETWSAAINEYRLKLPPEPLRRFVKTMYSSEAGTLADHRSRSGTQEL